MANPTKTRYEDWIGTTVYDSTGEKMGDITDLYYDDATGQPEWMTVSTGWFGTSEQFVPIAGTRQHDDGFRIEYTEDQVKSAPSIDADQDHLDAAEERRLYDHFGLDYEAQDHSAAYQGRERADEGYDFADQRRQHDSSAHADTPSVTRSEEQLDVDTVEREAGRVRLHKYVVTDDVELTVPVKRQVARIVREPASGSGSIGEESVEEVVLSEEEIRVDKKTVAKEQVGIDTDTVTDDETVHNTVRKEQVDVEGDLRGSKRR